MIITNKVYFSYDVLMFCSETNPQICLKKPVNAKNDPQHTAKKRDSSVLHSDITVEVQNSH